MPKPTPAVVVGIDGSRSGIAAARWAVAEAVSRDIPLHLVAVSENTPDAPPAATPDETDAAARLAVQEAAAAVAATGTPVRVHAEVRTGSPTLTLLEASRTAAMVCIGAVGTRRLAHHRIGSTAAALVAAAHCPVAVVRGTEPGWVVVEVNQTPDSAAVLQFGVGEARLRAAPLRVLSAWQSRFTDAHDPSTVVEGNRLVRVHLDRRLEEWKRRYPDLDAVAMAEHGSTIDYLVRNAAEIQLVVVGARNSSGVDELLGPAGLAALHDTDCSVVVVDPQRLL